MTTTLTRCALAVAAAGALASGTAVAQVATLRYTSGAPPKTVWAMQAERFAKTADEESKGALKIDLFLNAQLGSEQDTVQQVARGRIDMGGFSLNAAALIAPEISLLAMPLYFQSTAELDCVLDTAMTKPVSEMFAAKGVQFIGWGETGMLDLIGKKPFATPADVNGIKAGTYGTKTYTIFWSAVGANPVTTTNTEVASSLQTGLLDTFGTVATFYVGSGLNKIAPVLTRLEIASLPVVTLVNKAAYDALSAEQRDALARYSQRVPASQLRQEVREFEAKMRDMHEKNGGQIAQVTREQRQQWRDAIAPQWSKMVKESGPGAEKFFGLMEAGRKACEKRS